MKFRLLGAGAILAASVLAPQQAHALVATTTYLPFKLFQNPAFNTPSTLNFATFNSLVGPGPWNLTGVGFKIAGNADGTGSAMVGGNPRVSNQSEDTDSQAFVNYAPKWSIQSITSPIGSGSPVGPVTGSTQNATPNPVNCVATQSCSGLGGNTIPMNSNRVLNLQGSYNGSGGFASINNTWSGGETGNGVRLTNGSANFQGSGQDLAFNFDPTLSGSAVAKPFIMGFVAVQYQYNDPSPVPGPLPLFGAAAAFGWSRRLRKRVSSVA